MTVDKAQQDIISPTHVMIKNDTGNVEEPISSDVDEELDDNHLNSDVVEYIHFTDTNLLVTVDSGLYEEILRRFQTTRDYKQLFHLLSHKGVDVKMFIERDDKKLLKEIIKGTSAR
jgi:L-ribulose-5-phosphate 3-epimerase UlaE